ncbi:MAG: 2OG-Fe(II) oxygenase, partial [Catalinimonas sp.]
LRERYRSADPYPHIVLEDFLEPEAAHEAKAAFPSVQDQGWIHYVHFNEKKHGLNKLDRVPGPLRAVIEELNSPAFVAFLSELTGIEGLRADESLEGGGLHQSLRGGFLNIHADFTVHPHRRQLRRRVNVLVYFNEDWLPAYRGDLELWTRDMKRCAQKIAPTFNRCVIFNTDEDSFHGLPEPLACPEGESRKSVALYYFTEEKTPPRKRTTNYRARPQDGFKAALIYLDKQAVALYSRVKSTLGLNDDFVSNLLNRLGGKQKPKR